MVRQGRGGLKYYGERKKTGKEVDSKWKPRSIVALEERDEDSKQD